MRQYSLNETKPWSRFGFAALVTLAEYEAEGGRLQADLFTGDPIVLDPGVLRSIALDKARGIAREKHPEAAFIKEVPEGMYSSQITRHPGIDTMTPEQRVEYHTLRQKVWQLEEEAEPDAETGEIDPEAEAALAEANDRLTELGALAKPVFPDALKAMLGVYYQLTNNADQPVYIIDRALPDDLAPLIAAGFIEPPKGRDKPAPTAEEALEKTSASLEMRIARIKAHAVRMALASSPDTVLGSYVAHISNRLGYTEAFTATPETPNHAEPELGCGTSKAWDAMVALATEMIGRPDTILEMKPAEQRKLLAYQMLMCLTVRHPLARAADARTVRAVWSPSADFLRAYGKEQLAHLAHALDPAKGTFDQQKKAALCEIVASLASGRRDWLPLGF